MKIIKKIPVVEYISRRIGEFLESREKSAMRQQRLVVLLYAVGILEGVIPIIVCTDAGKHAFLFWINVLLWCIGALAITLYICRRLSLDRAINSLAVAIQLVIASEIVYCSTIDTPYASALVMENLFLAVVVVLLAATGYLDYMTYILSIIALSAYCYSMIAMDNTFMQEFCPVFFFVFYIICLSGHRIYKCTAGLENENKGLHEDEQEIQWLLRMDKQQVKAFVALSKSKAEDGNTGKLLNMVGDRAKRNIIEAVTAYQKQQEMTLDRLQRAFPALTLSEAEICTMILQDKRQSDICLILNKSASNINSQRSHIRKKLGLTPTDDLKEVLLRGMQ